MATFKQYSLNDGTKRWMVTGYLGVDYITGKQNNYKRRGFETKRAAQYAFNQAKLDFENGVKQTKSKTTFKEVYDLWFPVYKTTVRESTWITTKSRIEKYIIPEFGDILFERIDVKTAQKAVNDWAKKFGMYTKLLSYVKRIGDHAVAMSIIPINPFRQITNPAQLTKKVNDKKDRRNPKKKNLKFYSKKQLNAFLNYCEEKLSEIPESRKVQYYYAQLDYALFQLMAYSGARIGEILALTWSDIDFIDQTLNIDKTLSKTTTGYVIEDPKNNESIRTIDIDIDTLKILKKWQFRQKELLLKNGLTKHEYAFTDIEGRWMYRTDTYQRSKRIAEAAGVPFIGNHGFRHTHATMLFEAGVSPKEIQHRLGHASLSITMDTYTHLVKNNKKSTVNKLTSYLNS